MDDADTPLFGVMLSSNEEHSKSLRPTAGADPPVLEVSHV
jgi:hypothetical protein